MKANPNLYCPRYKEHDTDLLFLLEQNGECLEFVGNNKGDGYGRMMVRGKRTSAHRLAYQITYGPIPDGLLVCHRCDNPVCVRPSHLFLGTASDNTQDSVQKDRSARGIRAAKARLTEEDVLDIRYAYKHGDSCGALGVMYDISESEIRAICRGRRWRHV